VWIINCTPAFAAAGNIAHLSAGETQLEDREITARDIGIDISPEKLDSIFEAFHPMPTAPSPEVSAIQLDGGHRAGFSSVWRRSADQSGPSWWEVALKADSWSAIHQSGWRWLLQAVQCIFEGSWNLLRSFQDLEIFGRPDGVTSPASLYMTRSQVQIQKGREPHDVNIAPSDGRKRTHWLYGVAHGNGKADRGAHRPRDQS
jgi:hypothetical protein